MKSELINEPLEKLAFLFFYRYSRFEFALKENGYLRNLTPGALAAPDWHKFALDLYGVYRISEEARALIDAAPKQQIVAPANRLEWHDVDLNGWPGDFGKVVRLLQTVQNNLFHGGKHGADGWDDPVKKGKTSRARSGRVGPNWRRNSPRRRLPRVLLTVSPRPGYALHRNIRCMRGPFWGAPAPAPRHRRTLRDGAGSRTAVHIERAFTTRRGFPSGPGSGVPMSNAVSAVVGSPIGWNAIAWRGIHEDCYSPFDQNRR